MDQDGFRKLLAQSGGPRPTLTAPHGQKHAGEAQPAFKPRKVKKNQKYRDRAAERREGAGHEPVESEEPQEIAQEPQADDDDLEQAFQDASSSSSAPKKRTREDLIRQLKQQRTATTSAPAAAVTADPVKLPSKFKPIGAPAEEKKKKQPRPEGERKKKRKTESTPSKVPSPPPAEVQKPPEPPEPEPPGDFDIFGGVAEYEGLGDDDDNEPTPSTSVAVPDGQPEKPRNWFLDDEPEQSTALFQPPKIPSRLQQQKSPDQREPDDDDEGRLAPLASSSLPSIKEFLAMDHAAAAAEKKRKRKEKQKNTSEGKSSSTDAKVERDYKRLKSYTEKS